MSVEIEFTEKKNQDLIKFDLSNSDVSYANALRRIILSEVETYAFNTIDYNNSDIKIIENTSSLHNEFILHRIGFVPIYNIDNISNYKFTLNVVNTSNEIIDVTTKDFEVLNLKTNEKMDTNLFFPPNELTKDHILILRLKPNPGGQGEKIHLEGTASSGTGNMDARYSPVSNIVYVNKIDVDKYNQAEAKHIDGLLKENQLSESDILKEKNSFRINESERYFHQDEEGNPNIFQFTIESIGVIPAHIIFKKALEKLNFKLNMISLEFDKISNSQESTIEIKESPTVMNALDVIINNETHTLGYLLQSYLEKHEDINFVGYNNPHPLKKNIIVRISFDDLS